MPTPYNDVLNNFHSRFQSPYLLDIDLEKQFFYNALGEYEAELSALDYDDTSALVAQDLTMTQVSILGLLMYKSYLNRELDRIVKLNNIVGRDISLTGMGDSKRVTLAACEMVDDQIAGLIAKIIDTSYYTEGD